MHQNSNQNTLESYENRIDAYIDGTTHTVSGGVKSWIDNALSGLSHDTSILEIGSAFGRDATYMQSLGYKVVCTDAVLGFVSHLKEQGFNAHPLNVLSDPLPGSYDLVFANAVLLHFTRKEMAAALNKVFAALKTGGKFAFSLKHGIGEAWSNEKLGAPRYFCYWDKDGIEEFLRTAAFTTWTIDDDGTGHDSAKWLHVIAIKK